MVEKYEINNMVGYIRGNKALQKVSENERKIN